MAREMEQYMLVSKQTILRNQTLPKLRDQLSSSKRPHGFQLLRHIVHEVVTDLYPAPLLAPPTVEPAKSAGNGHKSNGTRLSPTQILRDNLQEANQRAQAERERVEERDQVVLDLAQDKAAAEERARAATQLQETAIELTNQRLVDTRDRLAVAEQQASQHASSLINSERERGQLQAEVQNLRQAAVNIPPQEESYVFDTSSPLHSRSLVEPAIRLNLPRLNPHKSEIIDFIDNHRDQLDAEGILDLPEKIPPSEPEWKRWIREHFGKKQQIVMIPDAIPLLDRQTKQLSIAQLRTRSSREAILEDHIDRRVLAGTALAALLAVLLLAGVTSCNSQTPSPEKTAVTTTSSSQTSTISTKRSITSSSTSLSAEATTSTSTTATRSTASSSEATPASTSPSEAQNKIPIYIGTSNLMVDVSADNHIGTGRTVGYVFSQPDTVVGNSIGDSSESDLEGFATVRTVERMYFEETGLKIQVDPTTIEGLNLIHHYESQPNFIQDREAVTRAIVTATMKSYNYQLNPFTDIKTANGQVRTVMEHRGPFGELIIYQIPVEALRPGDVNTLTS